MPKSKPAMLTPANRTLPVGTDELEEVVAEVVVVTVVVVVFIVVEVLLLATQILLSMKGIIGICGVTHTSLEGTASTKRFEQSSSTQTHKLFGQSILFRHLEEFSSASRSQIRGL
jgi:hypothetical protein